MTTQYPLQSEIVVSPVVDWLTISTTTKTESAKLLAQIVDVLGSELLKPVNVKPWSWQGYNGAQTSGARWGSKLDGALVMLSGGTCQTLWRNVAPMRKNCTRLDLAVTVELPSRFDSVAQDVYNQSRLFDGLDGSLILNSKGGTTAYVGSRSSRFYGRVYDKGSERGEEPGRKWRYEVEVKKPVSEVVLSQLLEAMPAEDLIVGYVHSWFVERGVTPLFSASENRIIVELDAVVTSAERQLNWLATQVSPTVERLCSAGFTPDVLKALKLTAKQLSFIDKEY